MKHTIRDLISLSSAERKGFIVLITLIFIILGVQAWIAFSPPHEEPVVDSSLMREIALFEKGFIKKDTVSPAPGNFEFVGEEEAELFRFDPNNISAADMKRLGLENKLIKTIINYRNKGGRFFKASDLNKIYGMNTLVFKRLEPYIAIKDPGSFYLTKSIKKEITGINLADSADLVKVSGIGPVLARRIIRYRELLGGFYDLGQLKEVYGLADSVILRINESYYADSANITHININTITQEQLEKHPYLGRFESKAIMRYRESVGRIVRPDELTINGLITKDQWRKIRPYIEL